MIGKARERNIKKNAQNELTGQRTAQKFLTCQRAFIAEQAVHRYSNIGHGHVCCSTASNMSMVSFV